MYLKSIEVHGFKSFANKINFEFHNGITGIVGPNGSGKSNVADAVRWVLGEQRIKQLRGASMQDVIFSGTENRKALGFAYVAITLDNTDHQLPVDYEEVTVARRIYRSGESEYLINGSACRLKDVNELFYDTGIGKEGYSIIGQGQIDKILSGKPEERRELFDEAAGIVKFKRRKATAQKKLEDERQNLVRVNDILSELEKQLGPLEKQAETAREYLKKKESLKIYDINMFLIEHERIREQLKELEEKNRIVEEDLETSRASYDNTKQEYERLEEEMEELQEKTEGFKNQLNKTNILKQQLEGQIEVLKEQINSERLSEEHLTNRGSAIREEIALKTAQKEELMGEAASIGEQLEEIRKQEQSKKDALSEIQIKIADWEAQMERGKNEIIKLLNDRASTRARLQRYDTMLEQIQVRRSQMNQKVLQIKSDECEQDEKKAEYEKQLSTAQEAVAALNKESAGYEREIAALQEKLIKENEQLKIGQTAYHREQSRLESLKNITERYDGYGGSIRRVMEKKDREPGLIGVVADIIKVEKDYEIAIETALGGSIQNIVTDNEQTAKRMIAFLKQNRFGRATFLPLTSIRKKQQFHNQEALKEPGVIGLASTLVHTDKEYETVAEYLLGRTIVADNIDNAISLQRKYNQTLRIVTVEGESLNPGGSMTGGAFKNTSNLLGRRREIEEFEKSVLLLKKELEEMTLSVAAAKKRRGECYDSIEGLKEKLQEQYLIQNTAKMNLKGVENKKEETEHALISLHMEGKEIEEQLSQIKESKEQIQKELSDSELREKEISEQNLTLQKLLEEERANEEKATAEAASINLESAGMVQKHSFVLQNAERISGELGKLEEELSGLKERKENSAQEIEKKEAQIQELLNTIEDSGSLFEELKGEIESAVKEKEEMSAKHKSFFDKREELSERITSLDKEAFRLGSQRERLEESMETQTGYMWEEYEITYGMAKELRNEEYVDAREMKKQIGILKDEIRKLGSVNVNAIEDFKEVSERFTFLSGQRDDLVTAEAQLMDIIEELDTGMRAQFTEKFKEISLEFDKVFKQLFGGGKGTLELQEDEDILEAGIRIIAQPPGKKLQNMMQLSGGEKALTAISLLFAIQNLKPSPFCLLDEIEAALDDSNVTRYAQYLHKLTKHTQFIIITHRRGTMAAADRLYGITMQEKGVSTLVSVNLIEDSLDK